MYPLMPVAIVRIFGTEQALLLCALFSTADAAAVVIGAPLAATLAVHIGWPSVLHMPSVLVFGIFGLLLLVSPAELMDPQKKDTPEAPGASSFGQHSECSE